MIVMIVMNVMIVMIVMIVMMVIMVIMMMIMMVSRTAESISKVSATQCIFQKGTFGKCHFDHHHHHHHHHHRLYLSQLRYLQTLNNIAAENNSTIVFPVPVDILSQLVLHQQQVYGDHDDDDDDDLD